MRYGYNDEDEFKLLLLLVFVIGMLIGHALS